MSIAAASLSFFRAQWAKRFAASGTSVVIKRETGSSFSEATGQTTPTYVTQYSGKTVIELPTGSDADYGQQLTAVAGYGVHIPYDESDPAPGDLVDVTSTDDTYLDGIQLVVTNIFGSTWHTVRILDCEENQDD